MKILLTGDKGFIGRHLSSYLVGRGYEVVGVDRVDGKEVNNLTKMDLKDVKVVVHLAAQTSVWNNDYKQIFKDNVVAFIHILNLCRELGIKFIYASSSCSINITSAYGFSKYVDDKICRRYGVGLRLHNVYGENSREDTLMGICQKEDKIVLYNDGKNLRHFTYVEDVCRCIEKSFSLPDGLYNVVNIEENSVEEFVEEVKKFKNIEVTKVGEKRLKDKERQVVDFSLVNLLDFPTRIREGITKTFK